MRKRTFSLRVGVGALVSTVALAALMTAGATTAFASSNSDSVATLNSSGATASGTYGIYDAADMIALDNYVESGKATSGSTFNLKADITLDSSWNGVGIVSASDNAYGTSSVNSSSKSFDGTFYGNSKTITLSGGSQGVFAYIGAGATVDGFTVASTATYGVNSTASDYVGAVAGYNQGAITNVTNNAAVYANTTYNVGGIVGFNDGYNISGKTYVKGCLNTAAVTGKQKVGGIAGENAGYIVLCENNGTIDGVNASSKNGVGGIAGRNGNNNTAREAGVIASCLNTGKVGRASQKWVGGITGFQNSKSSVTGCLNTGNIVKGSGYYNPIVGLNESSLNGSNYYSNLTNSSSTLAKEKGEAWNNTANQLNTARNTSLISDTCWSTSDASLVRTTAIDTDAIVNTYIKSGVTAINVYLDGASGVDTNTGAEGSPVKTLSKAAELALEGGAGSQILVSGAVTVDNDVTIRHDVTIKWTGSDANATMFTATGGTVTLGGGVKVIAGTGTSATAFDLTGGNLVAQDGTSITAGGYAAKVASSKTMSINNSSISGTIYLSSNGMLNLPSKLSSNISVECASLTTSYTAIANCGSDSIANANKTKISMVNNNTTLTVDDETIKCKLVSSDASGYQLNSLSLYEPSASNSEVVYTWNEAIGDTDGTEKSDKWYYTGTELQDDSWVIADSAEYTYEKGKEYDANASTSGNGYQWLGAHSIITDDKQCLYAMPKDKIALNNSTLTFEALQSKGQTLYIYVATDKDDIAKYEKAGSVTLDSDNKYVYTAASVDLSKYAGEYYVIFGFSASYPENANLDRIDTKGVQYYISNVAVTSEVASTDPAMTLTTDAKDLKVGDEVTVNVDMENITAYGQGTFSCSDNLTLKSIEAGSALKFDGDSGFTGTVDNKMFTFFNNTGTEDGTVAKATFTCTKAGDATVSLAGVKAGAALDPSEPEELSVADLKLSVGLNALAGDVNNSGKVNIVDAQVTYDMVKGNYADGSEARTNLLKCWNPETTGATYDLIVNVANVNGDELTASDAFAIQYFVHYGKFGATTEA